MHQIRFFLELHPRPRWGSLQRSPDPKLDLRELLPGGRRGEEANGKRRRRKVPKGRGRKGMGRKGIRRGEVEGVDIAWPRPLA